MKSNYEKSYVAKCWNGYIQNERRVYVAEKLPGHAYMQAGIRYTEKGMQLISYDTLVIDLSGEWLECTGLYSNTTRRHIGIFAKMIGTTYYAIKKAYERGAALNVRTGEMISLNTSEYIA